MTNSSDSRDPRQRRSRREPPTIDLKATEVKASSGRGDDATKSGPKDKPGTSEDLATGAAAAMAQAPTKTGTSKDQTPAPEPEVPVTGGVLSETSSGTVGSEAPQSASGTAGIETPPAGAGGIITEEVAPAAEVGAIVDPAVGTEERAGDSSDLNASGKRRGSDENALSPGTDVPPAGVMDPSAVADEPRETISGSSSDAAATTEGVSVPPSAETTLPGGDDPLAGGARTDESGPTVPRPVPEPRRSGAGASLGAGLLGSLLGAAAAAAILLWWQPIRMHSLEPRLAALEARLDALPRSEATAGNVQERIQAAAQERAALADRVRQLEERARSAAAPAVSGGQAANAGTDALAARLSAVEEQLRNQTQNAAGGEALDQRIAQQSQGLTTRLDEQAQRLASLESQLGERAQTVSSGLQALEQRVGEQGRAIDGLRGQIQGQIQANTGAVQVLERRTGEQDQRLADLARRISEQGAQNQAASLRVIAADRIDRALREGAPYEPSLQALRNFKVEQARLAALEPFAKGGAPSGEDLARQFEPIGREILRQSRSGSEDWGDRLLRMADRVVTVRPLDQPGGDSLPSIVARIERALERSAFGEALKAWQSLPEQAKQTSADFGRTLTARVAAGDAARQIAGDALAALDRPAQ